MPDCTALRRALELERNQELTFSTDFRRVYATVLNRWLNCETPEIFGADHEPVGFI